MVGLKCAPPPRSARPKPADVAARCPKLAALAELLLKEEIFEALPWQYQGPDSTDTILAWNRLEDSQIIYSSLVDLVHGTFR